MWAAVAVDGTVGEILQAGCRLLLSELSQLLYC